MGSKPNLETSFCGMRLRNPTVLASGVLGVSAAVLARVAREGGAGAVTTKSCCLKPRVGHPNPVMLPLPGGSFINAVGLSNPGAEEELKEILAAKRALGRTPLFASVFGETASEFGEVAGILSRAKPALLEANVSCPNVESEFGKPFAFDAAACRSVVESIKNAAPKTPLSVKLSPNAPNLVSVALACQDAGADAITATNTLGPGMVINAEARAPVLSNKVGGVSGAALKPVALRCVYSLFDRLEIPILGVGGIASGRDAVEMMMAGASAVGIGTAVYSRGIRVFALVCEEMREWMKKNGFSKTRELVGLAHEKKS
ncbi:MAG: dihydroorotate dehydrogenase [Candidatus Norongarragalinales archaeon]